MAQMNKALELIEKYGLKPNSYYTESPYKNRDPNEIDWDKFLNVKWCDYIADGYYGFSLNPIPNNCASAIDEFLIWIKENDRDFKILQVKIKYGGARIYIQTKLDIQDQIHLLENAIFDEQLIY
jgi:hypothetical protein